MKFISIIIFLIILCYSAIAQDNFGAITYNVTIPSGKTADYVSDISWLGFGVEGRRFMSKNHTFGLLFAWQVMDQRLDDDVINIENGAVSGTQVRSINTFPIMFTAHYWFGKRRDTFRPYLGGGVGVYYIGQRLEIGLVALESNNWHIGFAPEAGFLVELSEGFNFLLSGKLNYALDAGTNLTGDENNTYLFWNINAGFAFTSW